MKEAVRIDGFAAALFLVGLVLLVLPLTVIPGIVAMLLALGYWLIMTVVRATSRSRH